ncbi:hypothetical protein V1515DRAFT_624440 [Lipomyces mesembrius]
MPITCFLDIPVFTGQFRVIEGAVAVIVVAVALVLDMTVAAGWRGEAVIGIKLDITFELMVTLELVERVVYLDVVNRDDIGDGMTTMPEMPIMQCCCDGAVSVW